ncbi:hypothetical protein SUGI_0567730 [Cryptomeria japonica]|nr:hypothetical protein SUGI_0567730 [Cryptomeria japonica]
MRVFRDECLSLEMVISRIKVSIAKVVKRKLAGKKVKAYTWWDKKMEEKWDILKAEMVGAIVRRDKRQSIKWKVPKRNCYKFNFDGARKGLHGVATKNEAKLKALERGLKLCIRKDISHIAIEGDSQLVINVVQKAGVSNWRLKQRLMVVLDKLKNLSDFSITHTYREGNMVADWLANEGIKLHIEEIVLEEVSLQEELRSIIELDSGQGLDLPHTEIDSASSGLIYI